MKKYLMLVCLVLLSVFNVNESHAQALPNTPIADFYTRNPEFSCGAQTICESVPNNDINIYNIYISGCAVGVNPCNDRLLIWTPQYNPLGNASVGEIRQYYLNEFSNGTSDMPTARFYSIEDCAFVAGSNTKDMTCNVMLQYTNSEGEIKYFVGTTLNSNFYRGRPLPCPSNGNICLSTASNIPKDSKNTGDPIDLNNRSVADGKIDLKFPIAFGRTYNSGNGQGGLIGKSWVSDADKKIQIPALTNPDGISLNLTKTQPLSLSTTSWIQVLTGSNNPLNFYRNSLTDGWSSAALVNNAYTLAIVNNQYVLTMPNGDMNLYDVMSGSLISENFKNGTYLNYSYNGSQLIQITNNYNQSISFSYSNNLINQITASNGDTVQYSYANGYLTQATYNNVETYTYVYDSNGLMTDKYDENNQHYTHYDYDSQSRPIVNYMFDQNGNQINRADLNYASNYVTETKQNGNVMRHYFDSYNLTSQYVGTVNMSGGNGQYTFANLDYDTSGNLTSEYNYLGTANTEYTYDANNLVTKVKKENGAIMNLTWDTTNRLLMTMNEQTSNGNRIANYTYDYYHNVSSKVIQGNDETLTWSYTWSNDGRMLTKIQPNGLGYTYGYYAIDGSSASGLVNTITTSTGKTITVNGYDTRGNAISITGIDGITKTMTYDIRDHLISETVNGATNNYTYDLAGNLTISNFANGYQITMTYDPAHRLIKIEDNNGGSESFVLDSTTGKPLNTNIYQNSTLIKTMNIVLNGVGDTIKEYRSDSTKAFNVNSTYNDGSVHTAQDQNGTTVTRLISNTGLTTTNNYAGNYPDYYYDLDNHVKSINVNAQITNYTYDDFGRLTQLVSPDTGTQNLTYDTVAGIKTRVDASGITHTTNSDIEGKITSITHSNATGTLTETYDYSAQNRLKKITDNSGTNEYLYDNYGFLNQKTQTTNGKVFNVLYNNNNLGQTTAVTYPSGMVVNYTYNKGFLSNVAVNGTNIVSNLVYNSLEKQPVSWTLGNNSVSITMNTDGGQTGFIDSGVMNQTLSVDSMLNINSITDSINPNQSVSANFNPNYAISNWSNASGIQTHTNGINYNISSISGNGVNDAWSYDSASNLVNAYTNTPAVTYVYDGNGNLTTDNKGTYTYDFKNNMSSSNRNSTVGSYTYNAMSQRVLKVVGGQSRYFVYNESNQLIGEYDVNGNVINEYIYLGLRPVAVKNNGTINMVHTDYLGTPRYIMDSSNNLLWNWDNTDPFGTTLAQGSLEFNLRFAGQYYDSESSLHYNMFRTYDPTSKRYMQSDPIGLDADFNTYNYVRRNPLNGIDFLGLVLKLSADNDVLNNQALQKMTYLPSGEKLLDSDAVILIHSNFLFNYELNNDFLFHHNGGFQIRKNSQLYEDLKNTKTFKNLQDSEGDGVSGSTLAKMLNESKINLVGIKRIILLSCVAGATVNPLTGNLNTQDFADGVSKEVLASNNYLRLNLKDGGILTEGPIMFENFAIEFPASSSTFKTFLPNNSIVNRLINITKGLFK